MSAVGNSHLERCRFKKRVIKDIEEMMSQLARNSLDCDFSITIKIETPNTKMKQHRLYEKTIRKSDVSQGQKRSLSVEDDLTHPPAKIPTPEGLVQGLRSTFPISPPGFPDLNVSVQSDISDSCDMNITLESAPSSQVYENSTLEHDIDFRCLFESDVPLLQPNFEPVPSSVTEIVRHPAEEDNIEEENDEEEEEEEFQPDALSDDELGQALDNIYECLQKKSPVFISNAVREKVNMLDLRDIEELPIFGPPRGWKALCATEIGKASLTILVTNLSQYHVLGAKLFAQKMTSAILSLLCEKQDLLLEALNSRYDCFPLDKSGEQSWIRKNPLCVANAYAPKQPRTVKPLTVEEKEEIERVMAQVRLEAEKHFGKSNNLRKALCSLGMPDKGNFCGSSKISRRMEEPSRDLAVLGQS